MSTASTEDPGIAAYDVLQVDDLPRIVRHAVHAVTRTVDHLTTSAIDRAVVQAGERALRTIDDLTRALARIHSLSRAVPDARTASLTQDVAHARRLAGHLARDLLADGQTQDGLNSPSLHEPTVDEPNDRAEVVHGRALTRALVDASDLIRALDRAEAIADALTHRLHAVQPGELGVWGAHAPDLAARVADDLARAQTRTSDLLHLLSAVHVCTPPLPTDPAPAAADETPAPTAQVSRPGLTALKVSSLAARLLPPAARLRFEEELLDELFALAENDVPRRHQAACALRQLAAVPRLRALHTREVQQHPSPIPPRPDPSQRSRSAP